MNTVNLEAKKDTPTCDNGSIWKDPLNNLYILALFEDYQWRAVSLSDGYIWRNKRSQMIEAVKGLTYVGQNMTISVKN